MKFSWKRSIFTLFTGLLITGCATDGRQASKKPLLMGARGGIVPQPFEEPKAPVVVEEEVLIIGPITIDPVVIDLPIVEPVEPVTPIVHTPEQNTDNLEKYTVSKGDSLSRIAYKYKGFSYFELAKVNNLDVKKPLKIGQVLLIPIKGVKKQHVKATPKKISTKGTLKKTTTKKSRGKKTIPSNGKYVVKSGDSLWLIAHRYGISSKEIKQLNNLKSDTLHIGNVLILKGDAKPVVKTVEAPKEVAATNDVKPLTPLVPVVVNESVKQEESIEVVAIEAPDSTIFVEEVTIDADNATIQSISEMFGATIQDIQAQNKGVDLNNLKIGQVIKVPLK